ncbi:UpxY family transcription antiterminator [Roseivirga sp. E12]|uniref:UpxY family transcription antiterminator n=1 Tax=Roseivirga sp. E12 TaxID=2819237 RepID=UPI001ABCA633|nr:UpxY family transcription antiterminator [Roseivirga sp. E12]MBO3700901.1 UpxY family transcription antiterminator [Roseivirga sp. E12]
MNNNLSPYWTAFYTKPRSEKKTADRLLGQGFDVYCPTRTVVKQWSDRKKKVSEPVFTSYIFAKVDENSRNEILNDQGIVSNVFWLGMPATIRDCEILAIKSFLEDFPQAEMSCGRPVLGSKVEIESGPLSGQTGVVSHIQGNRAFLVIGSLGIEMHAEISLGHLKEVG